MGWLPELGDIVLGKYRVVRALGQGGMGVVFEAVNTATDGRVALKMLKPSLDGGSDRSSRMGREARACAKLRSRFVARVIDFDHTSDGAPVLVMELLEGRDLSTELRRTPVLSVEDTLSYVIQACAGVGEAHALGVIHRDLKPGNLFLEGTSGPPLVRVLDFGLSKDLETDRGTDLTSPSEALGTLAYMSPEQMRATKNVGPRTDVWSLGVVLYRALMGKLPLTEKGYAIASRLLDPHPLPRIDREDVPRELAAVVACALEKDPARRYADARALGHALRSFVSDPSPPTKLALDELGAVPSVRPSPLEDRPLGELDETTEASTTRTVVADAVDARTSIMPPPPRRKRQRHWLDTLSKETRMVLAGTGILVFATVLIAATSRPSAAPSPAPAVAPLPAPVAIPTYAPPAITVLPAAVASPVPSASVAPRPRPKPAPAPRVHDDENPVRL
ncbi:MAG: serine/threonine-protein kinase [Labilithrix sp.]